MLTHLNVLLSEKRKDIVFYGYFSLFQRRKSATCVRRFLVSQPNTVDRPVDARGLSLSTVEVDQSRDKRRLPVHEDSETWR